MYLPLPWISHGNNSWIRFQAIRVTRLALRRWRGGWSLCSHELASRVLRHIATDGFLLQWLACGCLQSSSMEVARCPSYQVLGDVLWLRASISPQEQQYPRMRTFLLVALLLVLPSRTLFVQALGSTLSRSLSPRLSSTLRFASRSLIHRPLLPFQT